jgi:putative spermidine/putrescine transport system substrate-binding protein
LQRRAFSGRAHDFDPKKNGQSRAKETGIETLVGGPPDLAKIRAMVRTRNIEWDVIVPIPIWLAVGEKYGLWEPVDYSIVDVTDVVPLAKRGEGVGFEIISGGICWLETRNGGIGKHPETFPEFFNTDAIPGRRGLRPREFETLELALLADGVPPSQMYPLDVDRAFRVLDRIKPHITHWIEATQQTISLVQQNECDFTYTYNGRVFAARQGGVPIGFSIKQNINSMDYLCVIKGSRNKDAAMRLLAFVMRPERQADFASRTAYAGTNTKAFDLLPSAIKELLPQFDNPNSVSINLNFWRDRQVEIEKRFREWLLK